MPPNLVDSFYNLQIKFLMVTTPTTLFQKLSELDWYSKTLHDWIDSHLMNSSLKVLDAGCATGYLSEYLSHAGHHPIGIDKSPAMINAAKKRNPNLHFEIANVKQLPFENDTFNLITSASLINIIPDPHSFIKEVIRICKPGGWITFLFPVYGFTDKDLDRTIASLRLTGFSKSALTTWHRLARKMSVEKVCDLIKQNGLSPCEPAYYLNGIVTSVSAKRDF